jgi:hypothetical protein
MRQTNSELFKRLTFAGLCASVITLITWLAYNDNSPLYGVLPNNFIFRIIEVVWGILNILPELLGAWLGMIISQNPHNINPIPIYVLMFVQWLFISLLFSGRILKRFRK